MGLRNFHRSCVEGLSKVAVNIRIDSCVASFRPQVDPCEEGCWAWRGTGARLRAPGFSQAAVPLGDRRVAAGRRGQHLFHLEFHLLRPSRCLAVSSCGFNLHFPNELIT